MADVAYCGQIDFLPDAFQPSVSKNEEIIIEVLNEADSKKSIRTKVPQEILTRIWDDFAPLRVPVIRDAQADGAGRR